MLSTSFAIAGNDAKKDSSYFEAEDAIRYAQFLDFYKFGEEWSAKADTSGKTWVVQAKRVYTSNKVIKDKNGQVLCDPEKGCTVEATRTIVMDKKNGKVLSRRRYTKIRSN
ncbi:MAG: hypothetical protein WED33_00480 [Bacteroidia bacterium]